MLDRIERPLDKVLEDEELSSLRFKKVGEFWSAGIGGTFGNVAVDVGDT